VNRESKSDRDRTEGLPSQPDFRTLFESAPGLYLVLTPDLHIVAVTDAYLQATMTTRDAILGRQLFDVFPDNPEDSSATGTGNLGSSLERVLATRRADVMAIQKYDIRRPASDGSGFEERYWSPINSPVLGPGAEILYIIHRVEDVTEFVRLKKEGHQQDVTTDELRRRAQQIEAEIYIRGQELLAANLKLRTTNGLLNHLYRQIEELLTPPNADSPAPGFHTAMGESEAESVAPEEMVARVQKLVANRNELEDQLRQAQKMEAVGRLAGGVAHDFNNLLTVILGYCSLLRSEMASPDGADCVGEIENAASRAAALTRQLLAFSRKQVLQQRVLSPNTIVAGMEEMLKRLIGEDIVLEVDLDPELGRIRVDQGQLEQVFLNLAVNARDAMEYGGTLRITTSSVVLEPDDTQLGSLRPGPYVQISVTDTGIGMDDETQARIFEPFFTTKEEGKGTGLGLATVYGIVKQSGGMISVSSLVGTGTTFTVLLPVTHESSDSAAPLESAVRSLKGGGIILLVEDDASLLKLISGTLKRAGYRVLEAASGKDALEIAKGAQGIDLLLTDVVMQGMTGPQLVESLQPEGRIATVLFMSGYARDLIGKNAAHINFLPKPFTPNALLDKVHEVLSARSRVPRKSTS